MPDQDIAQATETAPASHANEISDEIASSLASVWARYAGARPTGCAVEVEGDVVRWRLPEGLDALNDGLSASTEPDADGPELTLTGYKRATDSAVSKVTHRRVSARMSKQDKDTGAATETFILEAITKRY